MKKLLVLLILIFISTNYSENNLLNPPFIPVMTSGANIPVGFRYPSACSYVRNDTGWIYTFGGLQDGNIISNSVYKYNMRTDTWILETTLPDGPFWISASERIGNKLYNFGGTNALFLNNCQPRVKIYNAVTGSWSSGSPMVQGEECSMLFALTRMA